MWVWGGCCCDFDFVGVLYGVCKIINDYKNKNNIHVVSILCTISAFNNNNNK